MPSRFRSLVVSQNGDFREELVERVIGLNFSVHTAQGPAELPRLLKHYRFDWLMLDLAIGPEACQRTFRLLAEHSSVRIILFGNIAPQDLEAITRAVSDSGLELVGALRRPLSLPSLRKMLEGLRPSERDRAEGEPSVDQLREIPREEIVVHYQPIVAMADRTVRRVEALVRWQHPRHGLLRPARFIAMFERADMIGPLTWEVLTRALDQQVAWKKSGLTLAVSVNVSALFLASLRTSDEILALLRDKGSDPRHLILEITETEAAVDPPVARAMLSRLREAGVEVSMDDYGVGFSDLERLRYYPFSDLKIDRWVVAMLGTTRRGEARRIIEMLVALGHEQQFSLTAEGIETERQWDQLVRLRCDYGQGFLIARPMRAERFMAWIDRVAARGRFARPPTS